MCLPRWTWLVLFRLNILKLFPRTLLHLSLGLIHLCREAQNILKLKHLIPIWNKLFPISELNFWVKVFQTQTVSDWKHFLHVYSWWTLFAVKINLMTHMQWHYTNAVIMYFYPNTSTKITAILQWYHDAHFIICLLCHGYSLSQIYQLCRMKIWIPVIVTVYTEFHC